MGQFETGQIPGYVRMSTMMWGQSNSNGNSGVSKKT